MSALALQLSQAVQDRSRCYRLPGDMERDDYIVPISGGADSTVVAIILKLLFPSVPFRYVMTDTLAEDPEIYAALARLEAFLGIRIDRVVPQAGLFELIENYNGFLPSVANRFCTRVLKADSFKAWVQTLPPTDGVRWAFVGIRADEDRLALTMDEFETVFPLIELGVTGPDVMAILRQTVGVPGFYRRRVRSGCSACFFQRRSERVGLLQEQPIEFHRAGSLEKLGARDAYRHAAAPSLLDETGVARNWVALPLPKAEDVSTLRGARKGSNLFGDVGLFVVAEFFEDGFPGYAPFIWHQRIVSYSPTLAGAKTQAKERYHHLLKAGEVYDMSPDDARRQVRMAIYYIEAPEEAFDPRGPLDRESYTWHKGESYAQVAHCVRWAERVLWAEAMREQAASKERVPPLSVQYEWAESSYAALQRVRAPIGSVVHSSWYRPPEPDEGAIETRPSRVPCPMCSI